MPKKRATSRTRKSPRRMVRRKAGAPAANKVKGPGPASTFSPRLVAIHARLDAHMRRLFPKAQASMDWKMRGWKVPRPVRVAWVTGTMDPNWLYVGIAERKAGITLHIWNPYDFACLQRHKTRLEPHGLKAMVGCIQYTRRGDYPVDAVVPILDEIAAVMRKERAKA